MAGSEGEDCDTLAEELENDLLLLQEKTSQELHPPGHPKYGRMPGTVELVPLTPGQAGFARLHGSPYLTQI